MFQTEIDNTPVSKRILDLLENHETDEQFRKRIEQRKFLQECKEKGFQRLKELGADHGGVTFKPKRDYSNARHEIILPGRTEPINDDDRKQILADICKRLANNESLLDVAPEIGISVSTIKKWAKRLGVKLPSGKRKSIVEDNALECMRLVNEEGFTMVKAASKFGISAHGVRCALRRFGYEYNAKQKKYFKVDEA